MVTNMKLILLSLVMLVIGLQPTFSHKLLQRLNKALKKKGFQPINQDFMAKIGRNTVDISNNATWSLAHIGKNTNDIESVRGAVSVNTNEIKTNTKILDIYSQRYLQGSISSCLEIQTDFNGNDLKSEPAFSWEECDFQCINNEQCKVWTWIPSLALCLLKTSDAGRKEAFRAFSGPKGCSFRTDGFGDCFVENRLFVVNSTFTATAAACKQKCENDPADCTFWTWNTISKGCGIHYYEVNSTVPAQTQITAKKGGEELMDQVYVSQSYSTEGFEYPESRLICTIFCRGDPKCLSFTIFGPNFDSEGKNTCVLNYGPENPRMLAIPKPDVFPLENLTGFASAPNYCP